MATRETVITYLSAIESMDTAAVDDPHLHKSPVTIGQTAGSPKAYGASAAGTSSAVVDRPAL